MARELETLMQSLLEKARQADDGPTDADKARVHRALLARLVIPELQPADSAPTQSPAGAVNTGAGTSASTVPRAVTTGTGSTSSATSGLPSGSGAGVSSMAAGGTALGAKVWVALATIAGITLSAGIWHLRQDGEPRTAQSAPLPADGVALPSPVVAQPSLPAPLEVPPTPSAPGRRAEVAVARAVAVEDEKNPRPRTKRDRSPEVEAQPEPASPSRVEEKSEDPASRSVALDCSLTTELRELREVRQGLAEPAAALLRLEQLEARCPNSAILTPEHHTLRALALCRQGRREEGRLVAAGLEEAAPGSPSLQLIRDQCAEP